ncbi:MAG: hypothetical protein D6758_04335, partial [Gammaproteobacteria bacterium]
ACCLYNNLRLARSPDNRYVAFELQWRRDYPWEKKPKNAKGEDGLWLVDLKTREFTHVYHGGTNFVFTADSTKLCFAMGKIRCYDIPTRKLIVRDDLKLRSAGFGFMDEDNKIVNINPEQIEIYSFEGELLQTWPFTTLFENPKAKELVTAANSSIVSENGHYAYIFLADGTGWLVDVRTGKGLAEFPNSWPPSTGTLLTNYGDLYDDGRAMPRIYGNSALPDHFANISDSVPERMENGELIRNTLMYNKFKLINQ